MKLSPEEYWKKISHKAVGAGALFFNEKDEVLLVKPNYAEGWGMPGGAADPRESPRETCMREVKEELGLKKDPLRLLCVDYTQREFGEQIVFVYDGGVLTAEEIASIRLQEEELDEFAFVPTGRAASLLTGGLQKRFPACLKAREEGSIVYLEEGQKM